MGCFFSMNALNSKGTRSLIPERQAFEMLRLGLAILLIPTIVPAENPLDQLLKAVENHYNRPQSLQLDFSESYAGYHRPVQNGSGVLYLRKPGRMRWEYAQPPGKLFLSDGKNVFLYTPDERKAEKSTLKRSEDERTPIALLLGKLDFNKEFKDFHSHPEGSGTWVSATPRNENLAYKEVEFVATPDGQLQRLHVTGQDQSKLDFTFTNERQNVNLAASLFVFNPPAGVEIVQAEQ
jgi:outer membrane lipoprotein carrier protein